MQYLWIGLILGCQPKLSLHLQDPYTNPHPDCSPSESILSVGFAKESSQMSRQNAHAQIAAQIQSQIQTTVKRRNETIRQAGDEESYVSLVQESVVESVFSYNHLIQDVGPSEQVADGYYSLSCLNTSTLETEVLREMEGKRTAFGQLFESTLTEHSMIAFSSKRKRLWKMYNAMQPHLLVLRSLRNQKTPLEIDLWSQIQRVEDRAQTFRQQENIVLTGSVSNGYIEELQALMQAQGLTVHLQPTCGEYSYQISIYAQQTPTKGPMGGDLHEIKISAEIQDCRSEQQWNVVLGTFSGYHSNDPVASSEAAWSKATSEGLPEKIRSMFPVVQLDD